MRLLELFHRNNRHPANFDQIATSIPRLEHGVTRRDALKAIVPATLVAAFFPATIRSAFGSEVESSPPIEALLHQLFLDPPILTPKVLGPAAGLVDRWRELYGPDPLREEIFRRVGRLTLNRRLVEGWERLLANDGNELKIVYKELSEIKAPFELVFLALGESHWQSGVKSHAKAKGFWQFIDSTWRTWGKNRGRTDGRTDPVLSTQAAGRFLLSLYYDTFGWEKKPIPSDQPCADPKRWAWAYWGYNGGPAHAERHFLETKGDPAKYTLVCHNQESENYVPKILAIRDVLRAETERTVYRLKARTDLSEADRAYEAYQSEWYSRPLKDNIAALNTIRNLYATENESGSHSQDYTERALAVIDAELDKLHAAEFELGINTKADQALFSFIADEDHLSPKKKLLRLSEIQRLYEAEGKDQGPHNAAYIEDSLNLVASAIREVRKSGHTSFERTLIEGPATLKVEVDRRGEMVAQIQTTAGQQELETVDYKVRSGDNLIAIASRLSGGPSRQKLVEQLIRDLNPEFPDHGDVPLRIGQVIKIPADQIQMPDISVDVLLAQYFPGILPQKAIRLLADLNAKDPARKDWLRPGQIILVPETNLCAYPGVTCPPTAGTR